MGRRVLVSAIQLASFVLVTVFALLSSLGLAWVVLRPYVQPVVFETDLRQDKYLYVDLVSSTMALPINGISFSLKFDPKVINNVSGTYIGEFNILRIPRPDISPYNISLRERGWFFHPGCGFTRLSLHIQKDVAETTSEVTLTSYMSSYFLSFPASSVNQRFRVRSNATSDHSLYTKGPFDRNCQYPPFAERLKG